MGNENMKILAFGFKPYLGHKKNITEEIVKNLRNRKNLSKFVFPVEFNRKMFVGIISRYKPDAILGLGMHPSAKKIRIERRAVNLKQASKKEKARKIAKNKPRYRLVNLKLKSDKNSRITYNAGKYACNYCMYIISELVGAKDIKFAFLHIPKDYNVHKAVRFIESKIDEIISQIPARHH